MLVSRVARGNNAKKSVRVPSAVREADFIAFGGERAILRFAHFQRLHSIATIGRMCRPMLIAAAVLCHPVHNCDCSVLVPGPVSSLRK